MDYAGDFRPRARREFIEGLGETERLLAIEAIKRTKALYCFSLDSRDWDLYQAVYTDDAVLEVPAHGPDDEAQRVEGAGEIRRFVESVVRDVVTTHHCHTPIIDFRSATTGSVIWAMEDMLKFPPGARMQKLHGMGHYFEVYRRDGDDWRISRCRLARLRLEIE